MPQRSGAPRPGGSLSFLMVLTMYLGAGLLAPALAAQTDSGVQLHRAARSGSSGRRALAMPADGAAAYHNGPTLICSDCHAAHGSETHGFDGGIVSTSATPDGDWLPSGSPNGFMLKGT